MGANPNNTNAGEHVANKTKIELDSTILGIPGAKIAESTTMNDNTKNNFNQSEKINSPLPHFMANNIRTTHYEIGPGGKARPTETHDTYSKRDPTGAKFELPGERINFFKDSHFVIGEMGDGRSNLRDSTS